MNKSIFNWVMFIFFLVSIPYWIYTLYEAYTDHNREKIFTGFLFTIFFILSAYSFFKQIRKLPK